MTNEVYQWIKYNDGFWKLNLFNEQSKKRLFHKPVQTLPFLLKDEKLAPHVLEIHTFDTETYKRSYTLEKVEETEKSVLFRKKYDSNYVGKINSRFELFEIGGIDGFDFQDIEFLDGEFKAGKIMKGYFQSPVQSLREFKEGVTEYFKRYISNFGERLGTFITNSNLPEKERNSVRDLWK
jgi:hypothetical protein